MILKQACLIMFSLSIYGCNTGSSKTGVPTTEDSLAAAEHEEKLANAAASNFNLSNKYFMELRGSETGTALILYEKTDSSVFHWYHTKWILPKNYEWTARSFSTGFRSNDEIRDGDYGDVVIQDFNFDGKEDIALKSNMTNAGAKYLFFLQDEFDGFWEDKFLTETVSFFPDLDLETKTVSVANMPSASVIHECKYAFVNKEWKVVHDTIIESQ
jgi:hypothetical protein